MILGGWGFLMARASQLGAIFEVLPFLMTGFFIYAMIASWKAYKCFKEEYAR
jgi:hypothetical protein